MAKTIVITGATGAQGGGVANILLNTPGWKVRAVTRNIASEKAKDLAARGAEVVRADSNDVASLESAFKVIPLTSRRISTLQITKLTFCGETGRTRHFCAHQLLGTSFHWKVKRRSRCTRRRTRNELSSSSSRDSNLGALYLVHAPERQEADRWQICLRPSGLQSECRRAYQEGLPWPRIQDNISFHRFLSKQRGLHAHAKAYIDSEYAKLHLFCLSDVHGSPTLAKSTYNCCRLQKMYRPQ